MDNLGLKGAWKKHKGASLKFRIKEYVWDIRYAWQRAWHGYDNIDIFDLGFVILRKMPILLSEFKRYNDSLFHDLDSHSDLSEEETNAIIDRMIFLFENSYDVDVCYKRLFDVNSHEDVLSDHEEWHERYKAACIERNKCYEEALELFKKWGYQLWY